MYQYTKTIAEEFQNHTPIEILNKNLYKYRENIENDNFHFLIGLCMLKMGYLQEAYIAFQKALEKAPKKQRNRIFLAYTFVKAQHYDEAKAMIESIPLQELSQGEVLAVMEIKKYLSLSLEDEKEILFSTENPEDTEMQVIRTIAAYLMDDEKTMNAEAQTLLCSPFFDRVSYLLVIEELFKIKVKQEVINEHIERFFEDNIDGCSPKEVLTFLKTAFGCRYFYTAKDKKKNFIMNKLWKAYKRDLDISIQLHIIEYSIYEELGLESQMDAVADYLRKRKRNEQGQLCLVTNMFRQFDKESKKALKKHIELLISMNQTNLQYRKIYFDFLQKTGHFKEAEELSKATILMRQKEEQKEFDFIYAFHSFYSSPMCIFSGHENHEKSCPLCFGAGHKPIIRTMVFGHSPRQIFTEGMLSSTIEVNEKTLKEIVSWQPMNIPSEIVGSYLQSLGAYETAHDIPDVLVPGQTYIFIKMKSDTYKRLAKEGYSLEQVDPLAAFSQGIQYSKKKTENLFAKERKPLELKKLPVGADDFVLEIIKATSQEASSQT